MSSRSPSDCVLIHGHALPDSGIHCNATTAMATTSRGPTIEVTLSCPERPLLPTILFVDCLGIDFTTEHPRVVRAVEDLILFRALIGPRPRDVSLDDYDYFIYRPGGKRGPSLELLSRPHPTLHDEDVGLLRRGGEHYTIAALLTTSTFGVYDLHRFDSGTRTWSHVIARLVEPQAAFPYRVPRNSNRLRYHLTSTVIAIGGEGGTMGWVDLWRGILLCDVLLPEPTLHGVPVPMPQELLSCNNGQGAELGCPKSLRGIAVIHKPGSDPYLRFVHLDVNASQIIPPDTDEDIWLDEWAMRDWKITTWNNYKMTASFKDWHRDCRAKASNTTIGSKLNRKMVNSGLLSPAGAAPERALRNLLVSHPAPGIDDHVVYLQARVKFQDLKAFVLALDTRNNALLGAAEFATEVERGAGITYLPSNISRYIDPEARVLRLPEGEEDDSSLEESSKYEGTECLQLPGLVILF